MSCLPTAPFPHQPFKAAATALLLPIPHSLFPWYFQPVTNVLISSAEGGPGVVSDENRRPCPGGRGCRVTVSPGWAQPSPTQCSCPPRCGRRVTLGGASGGKSPWKTVTERLNCQKFPARLPGDGVCQPSLPLQSSAVRVSPPWRDPHPASRPRGCRREELGQGQAQGSAKQDPEPGSADLPRGDIKCHRFRAGQMPPRPYSESLGRNKAFQAQILTQGLTQRQNKVRTEELMGVTSSISRSSFIWSGSVPSAVKPVPGPAASTKPLPNNRLQGGGGCPRVAPAEHTRVARRGRGTGSARRSATAEAPRLH